LTGKTRKIRGKTCPNATLSTTNLTNPVLRGERPATNDLSHDTAGWNCVKRKETERSYFLSSLVALRFLENRGRLFLRFLNLVSRRLVRLVGRVVGPFQDLYLHRTAQHGKTRTNINALSGIGTLDPRVSDQGPRLIPRGHRRRLNNDIIYLFYDAFSVTKTI
jgi:hypothetical protein